MAVKPPKLKKSSAVLERISDLLTRLAASHSHLKATMAEDADFMYMMTYPLMPLHKKGAYGAVMADFVAEMRNIVADHFDEIIVLAKKLEGDENDISLFAEIESLGEEAAVSIDLARNYLAASLTSHFMELDGFDTLLHLSDRVKNELEDEVYVASLKDIVRRRVGKLTDPVESTGEFLITGRLMIALRQAGKVRCGLGSTDYGDLFFRRNENRPWVQTDVKFSNEALSLERTQDEFHAYCRIVSGR